MDRKLQILLVAGIIITLFFLFINIYVAGIVFVILAVIAMSIMIMQDSTSLPDIVAELSDDAKAVVIRNSGNMEARKIHVALVPENVEFDVPSLAAEATYLHPVGQMIEEIKVVIRFENEQGVTFNRTYRLSSMGENYDPLKPMMPLFGWK